MKEATKTKIQFTCAGALGAAFLWVTLVHSPPLKSQDRITVAVSKPATAEQYELAGLRYQVAKLQQDILLLEGQQRAAIARSLRLQEIKAKPKRKTKQAKRHRKRNKKR